MASGVGRLESFEVAYSKLLSRIIVRGKLKSAHDARVANALKGVYDDLASESNSSCDDRNSTRDDRNSSDRNSSDDDNNSNGGESTTCSSSTETPVAMESRSEYLLLRALDLLGNACLQGGLPREALRCFKMAHAFYADKFDRTFFKPRELKRKMAKILLDEQNYKQVMEELRKDVELDSYGTALDAETTLFIKYAYGRSLVAQGQFMAAVPYLSQKQLGQIDYAKKSNMEVLLSIMKITLEELSLQRVAFAMKTAQGIICAFVDSMAKGNCPSEIFHFASSLANNLASMELVKEFRYLRNMAAKLHSTLRTCDSLLLVSVIGCSYPQNTTVFKVYMDSIIRIHTLLLSSVRKEDSWLILSRLKVTTKLVFTWEDRGRAVKLLLETFNHVSDFLKPGDPHYNFFFEMTNQRLWADS